MCRTALTRLRRALRNLAASPEVQEERHAGTVIRDELALDFANAYEAARGAGLKQADAAWPNLDRIYRELSAPPEDPLWTEELTGARWSWLRALASETDRLLQAE